MSFQPKQNNNNSELPDGQVEEGAPLSLDEAVQSSQLETILGRINAIMTDGVPGASSEGSPAHSNEQVKSRNETVDAVAAPGEMTKNPLPESQNSIAQADVQRTEGPGLSETPAITEQSAIEGQEQFQSSE